MKKQPFLPKWKLIETINPNYPDGVIIIKEDTNVQRPVALVPLPLGGHKKGIEIQRKTATLVAAAPSLLNACREVLSSLSSTDPFHQLLTSTIEEATGENGLPAKNPDELLVCGCCGSSNIQQVIWIDPNTSKYITDSEGNKSDYWCNNCEQHTEHITTRIFNQNLESWWHNLNDVEKEHIVKIHMAVSQTEQTQNSQTSTYWSNLSFDQKRKIMRQHNPS